MYCCCISFDLQNQLELAGSAAGQAYKLAALGCILPAASASLYCYMPTVDDLFLLQNQLELAGSAAGQAVARHTTSCIQPDASSLLICGTSWSWQAQQLQRHAARRVTRCTEPNACLMLFAHSSVLLHSDSFNLQNQLELAGSAAGQAGG
jgi:hypothetical protein